MQTLADDLSSSPDLGATLFFSRLNGRSDPTRVFPTLAYQLALRIPAYKAHISKLIDFDPTILRKTLQQQFLKLIHEPFSAEGPCGDDRTRLVLIDGLDECGNEKSQREILLLITSFIQTSSSSPLLWVISSRPEYHLKNIFQRPGISSCCIIQNVPADGTEACRDVEKYLRQAFNDICNNFPDIVPQNWPSSRQFLTIAKAAGGLFAYARTVMRFIGDDDGYGDPVKQLNTIISILSFHSLETSGSNPLHSLDTLYAYILSAVPADSLSNLHNILGFYFFRGSASSVSLLLAANILGMGQNVIYHALQRLHSVLDIPRPHEAHKKSIRFHHKSFNDFLLDAQRSGALCLDQDKESLRSAICYTRKLEVVLEAGD
jgi:hypothetical protein